VQNSPEEKVIVALDVPNAEAAYNLMDSLSGCARFYKVGLQLFTTCGPHLIHELRQRNAKVFLDLKFHDIPNTVQNAVRSACELGVDLLTVHLSGGGAMLRAATSASQNFPTILLGVTVLTSSSRDTLIEIGIDGDIEDQVLRLARLGWGSGIRGFVASPHETASLRTEFGPDATLVVPGVRPHWSHPDDQQRVATPREAIVAGVDYVVIGRPIIAAPDPRSAFEQTVAELAEEL
jgi:orotidine-5'-phosphate decarboxylase